MVSHFTKAWTGFEPVKQHTYCKGYTLTVLAHSTDATEVAGFVTDEKVVVETEKQLGLSALQGTTF